MSAKVQVAKAASVALIGIEATVIEVEAWIGSGLPRVTMVGLPDAALTQAKERCRSALLSQRFPWPSQVLTINLTPASLPKTGSHYDLSISAAVLMAQGLLPTGCLADVVLMGELGLDGQVRAVRGLLPALMGARRLGVTQAIVPTEQLAEAALVDELVVRGVSNLRQLVEVLAGAPGEAPTIDMPVPVNDSSRIDLNDVVGLAGAKACLEVAAAGRHHLYFHGPPGAGKTLLASCLPDILPVLSAEEALEVAAIHSLAGIALSRLPSRPPLADPHHTASLASIIGGGARIARPGAVSLAHRGVLFLDEAPEFSSSYLEALRSPLESGEVVLSRSEMTVRYPARFQLVLTANPCPCGFGAGSAKCRCAPSAVRRYASALSGPILDRVDLQCLVEPSRRMLSTPTQSDGPTTAQVATRVMEARGRQSRRLRDTPWRTNSEV
ncbi:MAG: YifB family Mg chelatase-like AAA ATPase, partial [Propionibacteriaceae bacterium]|nr:YifB family Mg chelatase-like AAA ATPase [Propionibacteriaceae bacterium]